MNKKGKFYQKVLNFIQYLAEENRRAEEAVKAVRREVYEFRVSTDPDEEENRRIDNFVLFLVLMASISTILVGSKFFYEKGNTELEEEKSVKVENFVPKQDVFEDQYVLFPEKKLFSKESFFKNINKEEKPITNPVFTVMNNQKTRE